MPEIKLPVEIYREIFNRLDFPTALRFRGACKKFNELHTAAIQQSVDSQDVRYAVANECVELMDELLTHCKKSVEPYKRYIVDHTVRYNNLKMFCLLHGKYAAYLDMNGYDLALEADRFGSYDIVLYLNVYGFVKDPMWVQRAEMLRDEERCR